MKKFQLKITDTNEIIGIFDSKEDAINKVGEILDLYEENEICLPLPVFKIVVGEVNEVISDYEDAKKYVGCDLDKNHVIRVNPKHAKALKALNKLFTIAEAWNKADGFVPDYDDTEQWKWYPWFKKIHAGFVFVDTDVMTTYTHANFGSRIFFKSSERAKQFGEQFIDLWNEILL